MVERLRTVTRAINDKNVRAWALTQEQLFEAMAMYITSELLQKEGKTCHVRVQSLSMHADKNPAGFVSFEVMDRPIATAPSGKEN